MRSAWRVGEDYRPIVESLLVRELELKVRCVYAFEEPLSSAHDHGPDPETELVNEATSNECVVESAGAVFDEIFAGLVFQPGDRTGWIVSEEGGVPLWSVFEMRRTSA